MHVRDLMTPHTVSVSPGDTLEVAAFRMWKADVGFLPVLDDGRLVGVITDRDICMAGWSRGVPLRDLVVGGTMSVDLAVVREDTSVSELETIMCERQVHRLPVVDRHHHVVGIVGLADLARASEHARARIGADVAKTYAMIHAPREHVEALSAVSIAH